MDAFTVNSWWSSSAPWGIVQQGNDIIPNQPVIVEAM
jgi:hypothetical protein